jgi:hypothetical protein
VFGRGDASEDIRHISSLPGRSFVSVGSIDGPIFSTSLHDPNFIVFDFGFLTIGPLRLFYFIGFYAGEMLRAGLEKKKCSHICTIWNEVIYLFRLISFFSIRNIFPIVKKNKGNVM